MPNPFDQFDNASGTNPFDKFDANTPTTSASPAAFALPKVTAYGGDSDNPFGESLSLHNREYKFSDLAAKAAQGGVDVNSGGPYGMRSLVGLAIKPEEQLAAIQKYGAKGRIGPDTQAPEFFDDKTGRWTTVSSMNPSPNQAAAPTPGKIADVAGETLGGLAGAGGVVTTAAGIGLGRAASEEGKYIVGGLLGIRGDTTKPVDTEFLSHTLSQSAQSGATALIGGGVANLGNVYRYARYGPNLFSAPVFSGKYWPELQKDLSSAQSNLDDYYTLAGNKNLKLDVAQLSQHPAPQQAIEGATKSLKDVAVDYALRGKNNLSNLQETFQDVSKGVTGPGPIDPMRSGENVVEWAAQQKAAALAQQTLHEKVITDAAKREIDGMPAMSKDEINQRVTDQLRLIERADKETVDKAYGDLAVKLGVPHQVAYEQNSDRFFQAQTPTVQFDLTPVGRAKLTNYVDEAQRAGQVDSTITGGKLNAIPDGFLNKDGTLNEDPKDMYWVIQSIKGIRSGVRASAARSQGWIPPDSQDAARVAEILSNDVKYRLYSVDDGSSLEALQAAEHQAKLFGDKWRDSVLSETAEKYNGFSQYPLSSAVNHALFKSGIDGDKTALAELAKISNGDPKFQDSIRQSLFAMYRSQYTKDGLPTPALHAKFLEDFAGPIDTFFTPVEQAQIEHLKALGDVVAKRSEDVAKFDKAWKASPYGSIPANSMMIAKAAFSQSPKVQGIGSFLRQNNPGLLGQLQKDTALQLAQKVLGPGGDQFSVHALDRALNDVTGRNLQDIMPPEYVNSLRTISRTAKLTRPPGTDVPVEESLIHRAVKLYTGAWGTEARGYHLFRGFREKQSARLMYNILSDPEKLKRFMALKDQSTQVAAKAGFLSAVGASGLEKDQ